MVVFFSLSHVIPPSLSHPFFSAPSVKTSWDLSLRNSKISTLHLSLSLSCTLNTHTHAQRRPTLKVAVFIWHKFPDNHFHPLCFSYLSTWKKTTHTSLCKWHADLSHFGSVTGRKKNTQDRTKTPSYKAARQARCKWDDGVRALRSFQQGGWKLRLRVRLI